MAKQAVARKSTKKGTISDASSNKRRKETKSNIQIGTTRSASKIFVTAFIVVGIACFGIFFLRGFFNKTINKGIKEKHLKQNSKPSSGIKTTVYNYSSMNIYRLIL